MTSSSESRYPGSLAAVALELQNLSGSDDERTSREEHLLRVAFEIGDTDAKQVAGFLVSNLLPGCLSGDRGVSERIQIHAHRLRDLLKEWLDGLPDEVLHPVRTALIRKIVAHLRKRPGSSGLYCLAGIGYRSPATTRALKTIGLRHDSDGQEAIRLLLGLGIGSRDREWARRQLLKTPETKRTGAWYTAAAKFHEAIWLDDLTNQAVTEPQSLFAIPRLTWVAEEAPGDKPLQDKVWSAIMDVVRRRSDGWPMLLFTGGLFERCNTPAVLSTLLENAGVVGALGEVQVRRFVDRLQDARTAAQVAGWEGHNPATLEEVLRPLVQRSTGRDTVSRTIEFDTKENALEALLCSATPLAESLASAVVEDESNGYAAAEILNRLACFSAPDIPERVRAALRVTPSLDRTGGSNSALAVFMASARFAASSLHSDSLRLLLNSAPGTDGHPYRQPVRGAARLASWLWTRGETGVFKTLVEGLNSPSLVAQATAVTAISGILAREPGTPGLREHLRRVAGARDRQSYVRTEAIAGLLHSQPDESTCELLATLLEEPDPEFKRLGFCGLIMSGRLEPYRSECELFAFAPSVSENDATAAFVAGMLVATEPERYQTRAKLLVERGSDWTIHGFVTGYRYHGSGDVASSTEINKALVRRVLLNETEQRANPTFFADLALIAPQDFVDQRWEDVWYNWMPDSRVSIADAIPLVARNPGLGSRAEDLLKLLILDDVFAVRRSAARAMAGLNAVGLSDWCDQALTSQSISRRRIAAETAGWLPIDSDETLDNEQLRSAARDPERTVRSASAKAREALRLRHWSNELRRRISVPSPDPNKWVREGYAASRALSHIGDDADIDELRALARDSGTPPNVAYWLSRTADAIQKAWNDRTSKWPGAWLPWQGALEQVDATLGLLDQTLSVRTTLWLRRGEPGREPNAWGGVAWVSAGQGYSLWVGDGSGAATLTIPGRTAVRVLLVATDGTKMVFTGNDHYPDPPKA